MIVLPNHPKAQKLAKMTRGSAAYDIFSSHDVVIPGQSTMVVPTGLHIRSEGVASLVLSRSSLAAKGIWVANAPGLIDGDYDGELKVILHNSNRMDYTAVAGSRIAQLMPMQKDYIILGHAEVIDAERTGGLGSTGT